MRDIKVAVITGATGMIGMALTQYLLSEGITVAACVRQGSAHRERLEKLQKEWDMPRQTVRAKKQTENAAEGRSGVLHIVEADLEALKEESTLRRLQDLLGTADAFFHLGWAGTFGALARNDMQLQHKNIGYALDAVMLAGKLGCRVFVGAGSQAEYGRVPEGTKLSALTPAFPENGYGIAKLAAGQMSRVLCKQMSIDHIWMRILSVYGAWDTEKTMVMSAVDAMLAGEKPEFSSGEQLWDYLYVKDAAKALYLAAESGKNGRVYPLGSGRTKPLKEYIETIRSVVNPDAELLIGKLPYAQNQVMYLCADIEELKEDTGFMPEYTFDEGIRETAVWRMERKNEKNQCGNTML